MRCQPLGVAARIGRKGRIAPDAGNAQHLEQLIKELCAIFTRIGARRLA